jgi:hypothetical protein
MAVISFKRSLFTSNPDKYISFLAGNAAFIPTSYESIATVTGNGTASSVTFSSIPATYSSLQVRISYLATATKLFLQPNGDTNTANFARHALFGDGSTVSALGAAASTSPFITNLGADSSTTNPTVVIIDIHDYASTTKNKTVRVFTGIDNNGSGAVNLNSILWMSTTAISSLVIPNQNGTNYNTGSTFSLYGIKG